MSPQRRRGRAAAAAGAYPTRCRASRRIAASRSQIEAASLEVRDKQKIATFSGNVKVVQGDTTMRCKSLVVFYEQTRRTPGAVKAAQAPGPGGIQQISRLEARGGVTVKQKDQTATGDSGLFDMRSQHRHFARQCRGQPGPAMSCAATGWWSI